MVIKRTEDNGTVKVIYESSNILASEYNRTDKVLLVTFKKGTQYKYTDVANTDYYRFESADSQGKVFNTHIKNHDYEKLENVDPSKIVAEMNTAKADALRKFEEIYLETLVIVGDGLVDAKNNVDKVHLLDRLIVLTGDYKLRLI